MYRIYLDNNLIYDNHTPELSVSDATLELLQNDISTFQFTIYPNNPYINAIDRMVSRVTVYRDSMLMFSGLVCDDEVGFMNQRLIKCKSDLYYLTRTIVRNYEFSGGVKDYFTKLIEEHNAHSEFKFTVGKVTVTDPNDYITRASSGLPSTWNELNDKCIKMLGGYISLRYADGKTYIDYLADYEEVSPQKIEFGKNLLEAKREASGLDIATVLIPLGASYEVTADNGSNDDESSSDDSADTSATDTTTESKRVDITSVNDGKNYIENEDGIARYGRIEKTNTWDDVHEPAILLRKAKAYLDDLIYHKMTITVSAVDLANISKIDSFSMKQYIHVVSKPNGIDDVYLPMKMSINILDASQNKIELSVATQTKEKSEVSRTQSSGLVEQIISVENTAKDKINRTVEEYNSKIMQEKDSISAEVAESVSKKARVTMAPNAPTNPNIGDLWINTDGNVMSFYSGIEWIDATNEGLEKFINTTFKTYVEQTSKQFSFVIESYTSRIDSVESNLTEQLKPVRTYFTMKDDGLHIAKSGSSSEIVYGSDKISLCESGQEIAYIKQHKMYITDIEVTNSLRIGNYAFSPRKNGSVDFKLYKKDGAN